MSIKSIISAGTVLLLFGTIPSVYAQHDQQDQRQGQQHDQAGPPQGQAPRAPQASGQHGQATPPQGQSPRAPQQQPQHTRPTAKPAPPAQRSQGPYGGGYHGGVRTNEPTNGGVHPSGVPQSQTQARNGFLQSRAGNWSNDHRTWQQRGGYNGYRVPDDRFRLYFGNNHFFRIGSLPLLFVGGYPRFQYDGYWVTLLDPWPENWPPLWYESDNVYVEWGGDGYYLYDANYPGVALAVTISF